MRKYVNGKLFDMTEDDKLRMKKRKMTRKNKFASESESDKKIKELEETVKELVAKLAESEQ